MAYGAIILLACGATLYLLWVLVIKKRILANKPIPKEETCWVRAVFWAIFIAVIFGDPIIVHNMNLAVWGEASIFFAVFFIQIFLDKRTRLRGIMALSSLVVLGV